MSTIAATETPTVSRSPSIHDERSPLLTPAGEAMLRCLKEHPDAPRFNYQTGDRLRREDLAPMAEFRESLRRREKSDRQPPQSLLERVERWRRLTPIYRRLFGDARDLAAVWTTLPTTSRADIAVRPWEFVPDDQPLERLIIYRTAGTTGHPISAPHHPLAVRCYEPMLEFALERHGARPMFSADTVACLLVGAQVRTYTYATVLYNWQGAGFAKLNLRQTEWPREGSQQRYFDACEPRFLTGDPISFAEMMRMNISARPLALVTTSVAMSPTLKQRLSETYRAPVIDWYSMVETGPIGYACPRGDGAFHVISPDVYVESLGDDGQPVAPGQIGEIAVSGGRNVFLPLVRYRTGDFGRIELSPCECGDPMPRLVELEGRRPVLLRSADGTPVTTVDLSRLLREFPLLLHEFYQRVDRSCELAVRPLPGVVVDPEAIAASLARVLGPLPLHITVDDQLGLRADHKTTPYRSDLED